MFSSPSLSPSLSHYWQPRRTSYCSFTPSPANLAHCVDHPPTGSLPRLFYVPCFARTTLLNRLPTPARILRTRRALCLSPSDLALLQALACLTPPRIDVRTPVPELSVVAQVRTMTSASRPQARALLDADLEALKKSRRVHRSNPHTSTPRPFRGCVVITACLLHSVSHQSHDIQFTPSHPRIQLANQTSLPSIHARDLRSCSEQHIEVSPPQIGRAHV